MIMPASPIPWSFSMTGTGSGGMALASGMRYTLTPEWPIQTR